MAVVIQSSLLDEDEEAWDCRDAQYVFASETRGSGRVR